MIYCSISEKMKRLGNKSGIGSPTHPTFLCQLYIMFFLFGISTLLGCHSPNSETSVSDDIDQTSVFDGINQTSMFDGKELGDWEVTDFYEHGHVYVQDGCLILLSLYHIPLL